jgi:DNA repair protein RadC
MPITAPYRLTDTDANVIMGEAIPQYVLRVKDLPDAEKPREKLLELGAQNLTNAELLALVWGTGTRREEVLQMAQRSLKDYGSKAIASEHNPRHLAEVLEIPISKACQVITSFELGRRFFEHTDRPIRIHNAKQAHQYLHDMGTSRKEQLRGLYLNSRYQLIHDEVISIGSLTSNIVHPREVFQPAIERGAVALIIAHNHPSGVLEPTTADINVTEQLISAGKVLGIELLDHLIIAKSKYISIMECISRA